MVGVFVTFDYDGELDRERVLGVAEKAHAAFEGMPELRMKVFTLDPERNRATNFYIWESDDAARRFFTDELTERVTGLYGVAPRVEFVEIAAVVDNAPAAAAV